MRPVRGAVRGRRRQPGAETPDFENIDEMSKAYKGRQR